MMKKPADPDADNRIVAVTLDEESIGRSGPDIEHERAIATYDLVEKNLFAPEGGHVGPFTLHIGITGNRLMFDIRKADGEPVIAHLMSLTPFRRIIDEADAAKSLFRKPSTRNALTRGLMRTLDMPRTVVGRAQV